MASRYTFGDSDVAAERLRLVAEAFAPSSESFLGLVGRSLERQPRLVVDLGCGLGLTTALLASAFPDARVVGLDRSLAFLDRAQGSRREGLSFLEHDVARTPFPARPADLLFCRFLLTHLHDPTGALRSWRGEAAQGGALAIEELEHLSSSHPALAGYYEILRAMQESYGQDTHIGGRLEGFAREAGWVVRSSRLLRLDIGGRRMARLHLLNFATWRADPFVVGSQPAERIDAIERGLAAVVAGEEAEPEVDYRLRQVLVVAK